MECTKGFDHNLNVIIIATLPLLHFFYRDQFFALRLLENLLQSTLLLYLDKMKWRGRNGRQVKGRHPFILIPKKKGREMKEWKLKENVPLHFILNKYFQH